MVEVVGCFTLACRFSMSNKMGQKVHGVVRRVKCNWLQIALVAFLPCMQAVPTPLPFVYLHYMYLCKESNYRSLSLCRLHHLCLVQPRCCWLHHLCPVQPRCCWLHRFCLVMTRCYWLEKFGKHSAITCKPGSTVPDIVCYCLDANLIVKKL